MNLLGLSYFVHIRNRKQINSCVRENFQGYELASGCFIMNLTTTKKGEVVVEDEKELKFRLPH
jgi:hypothetical protein